MAEFGMGGGGIGEDNCECRRKRRGGIGRTTVNVTGNGGAVSGGGGGIGEDNCK